MKLKDVTVINQTGLRARVATIFVSKASEFKGTTVSIRAGERLLNGKSLLGVLSGNITYGTTIQLVTNGPDEEIAMNTLVELIVSGFEDY